jgi:hypothetical protein
MNDILKSIEAAIESHPLCGRITQFLVEHEHAMDTLRGIDRCWVNSDEIAVKSALDKLLSVGVLVSHSVSSGTYYSLTLDASVRAWLKANRTSAWAASPTS